MKIAPMAALCAVLALGAAVAVARDDEKGPKAGSFAALEKEFMGKIRSKDMTPEKQKALLAEYGKKFLEFAEKNPKDAAVLDSLSFAIRTGGPSPAQDSPAVKALAVIKADHLTNPKIKSLLGLLAGRADAVGLGMLKDIIAKNPDRRTQAKAAKTLEKINEELAAVATKLADDEKLKANISKGRGEAFVKYITDNKAAFEKDAKTYAKLVKDKYADLFPEIAVGKPVPEVVSADLDGKEVKLSQLKGKVVVLDIWATWCGPCRGMIPHTKKTVEKYKGKPFVFVSVSADDKVETVKKFVKETPMPWTQWYDGTGGIVEDWSIGAFPTIFVIDAKGVLREKIEGADTETLDAAIEKAMKDVEDKK